MQYFSLLWICRRTRVRIRTIEITNTQTETETQTDRQTANIDDIDDIYA